MSRVSRYKSLLLSRADRDLVASTFNEKTRTNFIKLISDIIDNTEKFTKEDMEEGKKVLLIPVGKKRHES